MDVYLMQHGVAVPAEEDPSRPLTAAGRDEVRQVAAAAAAAGVRADVCVHSGKVRAEQTAAILAGAVGARVHVGDGLGPSDPVGPVADWLQGQAAGRPDGAVLVVGHLPFLDRLASLLLTGDPDLHVVRFRNAGLVKLVSKPDSPGYSVAWILTPELAAVGPRGVDGPFTG